MAGVTLKIDTSEVQTLARRVQVMAGDLGDTRSLMPQLGEYLRHSTQERFKAQAGPDDGPWAVLLPHTVKRKKHNPSKILTERGFLRRGIHYQVTGPGRVEVGSALVYAATHQFGRGGIPARPFLGISRRDERQIGEIVRDWMAELGQN